MAEDVELPEVIVEAPDAPLAPIPADERRTDAARPFQAFDTFQNQSEYATLIVGHLRFTDWTSIFVQERRYDGWLTFKFTCADAVNLPEAPFWNLLQFKPGDACEIYLGRERVLSGVILNRQAAYDARSRGVVLDGRSLSWWALTSGIVDQDSRYEGSLVEIARKVLAPTGIAVKTIGNVSSLPFKPAAMPNKGETIGTFLERLARERNVLMTGSRQGDVVFVGEHSVPLAAELIEGVNILKCQCIISDENKYTKIYTYGQSVGGDDKWGIAASEQEAVASGSAKRYRVLVSPMEHPVWTLEEVNLRNKHELMWTEGTDVTATIDVQGWFTPAGVLWSAGMDVLVKSPMAMLNQVLSLQSVTFTQDRQSGTKTTLVCQTPWSVLNIPILTRGGSAPPESRPDTGPAQTPPAP